MISLGGLQLSDNLRLLGLRASPISADVQRSEGGVAHILMADNLGGRELRLEGLFTSAQVDAIMALAGGGQSQTLIHPRGTFTVLVIGSDDLADWFEYVEPNPDEYEEGSIILLEI